MNVSSVKNLNGETFSAVQDATLTNVVQSNSATWSQGGNPEVESYVQTNSGTIDDTVTSYQTNSGTFLTAHQDLSNYQKVSAMSAYIETSALSDSDTLIRDSYFDGQTSDYVFTGPYQVSNSAWVKYPQGPLSTNGNWGGGVFMWSNARSGSYFEATLNGEFPSQYWPSAGRDSTSTERFYLVSAVDDGEHSSATYTATFSTASEGNWVGYWNDSLLLILGEAGDYVTNGEGKIRKYEPSGIKELAFKENLEQVSGLIPSTAGLASESYVQTNSAVLTGMIDAKQDTLTFGYDTQNKISAINNSALAQPTLSSLNDANVNNIVVTAGLPSTPDANTLYLIPEA